MSRAVTCMIVCLVASAALVRGGSPQSTQTPTFRSATDLVSVDVSVRLDGTSTRGLTAADFVLLDNGVPQKVETLDAAAMPLDVTVVADVSSQTAGAWTAHASTSHTRALVDENVRAIAGMLRPEDRLRLLAVDTYTLQVFAMRTPGALGDSGEIPTEGLSSVYDALVTAMLYPAEPGRRHLIVAWTKAVDTISGIDATALRDVARQSDAVVHIVARDFAPSSGPNSGFRPLARLWRPFMRNDPAVIADVAAFSGGSVHGLGALSDVGVADAFRPIFDEFRHGYVLRYTPQSVKSDGWHNIEVRVPRLPTAEIHARRGYAGALPPRVALTRPPISNSASTLDDLVASYDHRNGQALLAWLRGVPDLRRMIRAYRDGSPLWSSAPKTESVFVLELAQAGLFGRDAATRDEALALLGMQHDLVRQPLGADAFECAWYGGELALLEGGLLASQAIDAASHALERCPDDTSLLLARAIAQDQLWSTGSARGNAARGAKSLTDGSAEVLARYREAMASPMAAADAGVRAAWVSYRIGNYAEAIAQLDAADRHAPDTVVRFFSQLMRGHVLEAEGRVDDARGSFRDALLTWPGAQSARVALMTILVTSGDRREAESLAEAIQSAPADQIDPWWVYWQGDYRAFDGLVTHLRELAP